MSFDVKAEVIRLREDYLKRVRELAIKYREQVMLPLCRQLRVVYSPLFTDIDRRFCFSSVSERGSEMIIEPCFRGKYVPLNDVFAALEEPVFVDSSGWTSDMFGYYVPAITLQDL